MTWVEARPTPFGAISYLANFYGIKSAKEFLSRIDIKAPSVSKAYEYHLLNAALQNEVVGKDAARYIGLLPVNKLNKHALPQAPLLQSNRFRACKQCLGEGVLHQEHWQYAFYTHCHVHSSLLSDACEHIYADESWKGCKYCESGHGETSLPAYLEYAMSLGTLDDVHIFITDLILVAERMHRPFDFIAVELRWETLSVETVSNILNDAFLIGCSNTIYDVWSACIKEKRTNLNITWETALHFGLDKLRILIQRCNWSRDEQFNDEVLMILLRYHNELNKLDYRSRHHINENDTPDCVSLRANNIGMAEMLNVRPAVLRELIDNGKLPVKKDSKRGDKLIFDLTEVSSVLNKVHAWSIWLYLETLIAHAMTPKILNTLLLDRQKINEYLISGQSTVEWRDNGDDAFMGSAMINKFAQALKAIHQLELHTSEHLSVQMTGKFLGIRESSVVHMVKRGYLHWARWQRTHDLYISIKSVKSLIENHVVVNREAILKGVGTEELTNSIMSCCGCAPSFEHEALSSEPGLVVFDKSTLNACCLERAQNKLEVLYAFCISWYGSSAKQGKMADNTMS